MAFAHKTLDLNSISKTFLSLYEQEGFVVLPSSSMLHPSVPMSFVMSAGLIQVENNLDQILHQTNGKFAFMQPCFRYFDMKQVGVDATHLSLFHMAAAFHIGCSQRETTLPPLWHFLTITLGLGKSHLWITYLDDPELGRDDLTYQCWRNLGVEESHLLGLDQHHCFWRQRSLGQIASDGKKCGPHTEVFYERPEITCCSICKNNKQPLLTNCRCGRFVEISNSLFIENYINDDNKLISADTVFAECVIGLERIAMVLEEVANICQIQHFEVLRERLFTLLPQHIVFNKEFTVNLILDHINAFIELASEGAPPPGRGGRARIMRNLARNIITQFLLYDLPVIPILENLLIEPQHQLGLSMLQIEFIKFQQTIERGQRELKKKTKNPVEDINWVMLEKDLGIPEALLKKYYSQITHNCCVHPKESFYQSAMK